MDFGLENTVRTRGSVKLFTTLLFLRELEIANKMGAGTAASPSNSPANSVDLGGYIIMVTELEGGSIKLYGKPAFSFYHLCEWTLNLL